MTPLLLNETAAIEVFLYLLAAAGVLALLVGAALWAAVRDTQKTLAPDKASARSGCTAAAIVVALMGAGLLWLLF